MALNGWYSFNSAAAQGACRPCLPRLLVFLVFFQVFSFRSFCTAIRRRRSISFLSSSVFNL
ncbi:hypothetical protein TYRP_005539 [Tyrophagus putrescentiae]|nr:hypothetical protein TYRP_005539 [Tyrophagus putrescentiae]